MVNGFLPAGDPGAWGTNEIRELIGNIINMLLVVGGAVAVVFIILGAISYLTAFGDETKAEQGKKTLTWALIGLALIIVSRLIVGTIWGWAGGVTPWLP